MKKLKRYHIFIRSNFCLSQFPLRILKFKKQKWLPLIAQLKKNLKPLNWKKKKSSKLKVFQIALKNISVTYAPRARWFKIKRSYQSETCTKRLLYIYYQKALTRKAFRKETQSTKLKGKGQKTVGLLVKPLYRIDILLYFLNFFFSVYQAKQFLARGKLLLNNNLVKSPIFLQHGNLLSIKSNVDINNLLVSLLRKQKSPQKKVFTFLEVDYYTKALIIVNTLSNLTSKDLTSLLETRIRVKSFKHVF